MNKEERAAKYIDALTVNGEGKLVVSGFKPKGSVNRSEEHIFHSDFVFDDKCDNELVF